MFCAFSGVMRFLQSSSYGAVSPSEFKYSMMFCVVFCRFGCALKIFWKAEVISYLIRSLSVIENYFILTADSGRRGLYRVF